MDDVGRLYFAQARRYDAGTGRFVSEDKVRGFVEAPVTLNRYGYCWNNPCIYVDDNGLYLHLIAGATVGIIFNVGTRIITDVVTGHASTWQEYAGDIIGGAVSGAVFAATCNAVYAGAANGTFSTLATKTFKNISGEKVTVNEMMMDTVTNTVVGAGLGYIGGKYSSNVEGVNAGRGSYKQIIKMLSTQMKNGTMMKAKNGFMGVSWKNWYKAFVWQLTEQDPCASIALGLFGNSGILYSEIENLLDKVIQNIYNLFNIDNINNSNTRNECYIIQ